MSTILRDHRKALAANPNAFEQDLPRLSKTLAPHIKSCGYKRAGSKQASPLIAEIVEKLFEAQGRRPLFHIDADLPYCWNAPGSWEHNYIRYEWGHLRSRSAALRSRTRGHRRSFPLRSARERRGGEPR